MKLPPEIREPHIIRPGWRTASIAPPKFCSQCGEGLTSEVIEETQFDVFDGQQFTKPVLYLICKEQVDHDIYVVSGGQWRYL